MHRKAPAPSFFFDKAARLHADTLLKNRLQHRYFPVDFGKFFRTPT